MRINHCTKQHYAGDSIFFGGGKIIAEITHQPSMTDEVHELSAGADGRPRLDGLQTIGRLSLAREAAGTINRGDTGVIFAGGTGPWPPVSVPIVDTFTVPVTQSTPNTWDVAAIPESVPSVRLVRLMGVVITHFYTHTVQ